MKKGEIGIGALILFVTMVIVSAVAAGVLLSTAMSLQSKALLTGKRTKDKVATQIQPVLIYGEGGSNGNVDKFYIQIQLSPGSESIKFDDLSVVLKTSNDSQNYIYNSNANCSVLPTLGYYAVEEIMGDNDSTYLSKGEIAKICLKYSRSINEDEKLSLELLSQINAPLIMNLIMPSIINSKRVILYP